MQTDQPDFDRSEFGRELRRLRERGGMTQVQLAARLRYNHTYLSKIESGDRAPRIEFASQADDLLKAGGVLLALATKLRARRRPDGEIAMPGSGVLPLPDAPPSGAWAGVPPVRHVRLPTLGVTCPLHGSAGCTASTAAPGLADLLRNPERVTTVGEDVIHGLAALLTVYIEANHHEVGIDLVLPAEHTAHTLTRLARQVRAPIARALLQLAARYAELAGWLRVERGQHGIGMMWLQRSTEWAMASGNLPTACKSLGRMNELARLEGEGATAIAHSRAMAAVDQRRRWTIAEGKLREARAFALLGDLREFERQSHEALRVVERLGDRDRVEAHWLFDAEGATYLASHMAGGLRDIADATGDRAIATRAVASAEASLATLPTRLRASRLMLTLRAADSYACAGDLDAAIAVARPVIATATSIGTTVITHELGRFRARLGPRFDEAFDTR